MNHSIRTAFAALAIMTGAALTGCASMPGNTNGLGTDGMSMVVVHKNPYAPPMTDRDYNVAVKLVNSCLHDVQTQQAGLLETMVTNGAMDTASGYIGGSAGESAEAAELGVKHLAAHAIPAVGLATAAVTGAQGLVNGVKIKSGAVTSIVGTCANGDLHDPVTAKMAPNMHIYSSALRTNNSSHQLPSWIKRTDSPFKPVPSTGAVDLTNPDDHGGN